MRESAWHLTDQEESSVSQLEARKLPDKIFFSYDVINEAGLDRLVFILLSLASEPANKLSTW